MSSGDVVRVARELAEKGQREQALAILQSFLQENPESIPALLWYAALTPDLEKGIQALERILHLDPGHVQARAGLEDLRARLSRQRGGGEGAEVPPAPPQGEPARPQPQGESGPPPSPACPLEVSGDEILRLAGGIPWPFRGLNRPIAELLEAGQIRDKDLAWAGWKAYDPLVRWAAGVFLRRNDLQGQQFSYEHMEAMLWPYRGLNRPLGELLRQGLVSLGDLADALVRSKDKNLRHAAAVLGYPIALKLPAMGSLPPKKDEAEGACAPSLPETPPPSGKRAAAPIRPAAGPSSAASPDRGTPSPAAPSREPLVIVQGSGYLEKERRATQEKRRRSARWMFGLVIAILLVLGILLHLLGKLPPLYAWGIFLAAIGILLLLDRLGTPFLRRLQEKEEDFLAGKEGEDRLTRLLGEHLDSRWTLFRNVVLPDRGDDIDAVLVGPQGLYALEVKAYRGYYRYVEDRWECRRRGRWEPFGKNPVAQAQGNAARLGEYLKDIVGDKVWVEPAVVWAGKARIDFEKPRVRIWRLDRPDFWLSQLQGGKTLPAETVEKVRVALKTLCSTLR